MQSFLYPNVKKFFILQLIWEIKAVQKIRLLQGICLEALSRLLYFLTDLRDKTIKRSTKSPGYDAEATVAFDGSKIIYTSIAVSYTHLTLPTNREV